MKSLSAVQSLYIKYGNNSYGEEVSQIQHAIQVARLAEENNASEPLIAASLLHDIGHLLSNEAKEFTNFLHKHEYTGANFINKLFDSDVVEPVKYHVLAKRYLCSVDANYHKDLSQASSESLVFQGGLLNDYQLIDFEKNIHFEDAVKLRQWDDLGKNSDITDTDFESFLPLLKSLLL